MYKIQQLNNDIKPVFGIVSNGDLWKIGYLEEKIITVYRDRYDSNQLDELLAS